MTGFKVSRGSNSGAGITSTTAAIPATSTLVTLTQPSNKLVIKNYSATATLYVSFSGPATSGNFSILPATAGTVPDKLEYDGDYISTFYVLGSAASGNYGVLAH